MSALSTAALDVSVRLGSQEYIRVGWYIDGAFDIHFMTVGRGGASQIHGALALMFNSWAEII